MTLAVVPESPPLKVNADGVFRIGNTRITLDTVVAVFKQGLTQKKSLIVIHLSN